MPTSAVSVIGPLAFVVVLELARLARDIPLVGHEGDTERLDYDTDPGRVVRFVNLLAARLGYSDNLVSVGGFHVVFTLTEGVLYGSILIVYLSSGAIATADLSEAGTSVGVVAFLSVLWLLLPVIVVDRYDDLSRQGVRPFSVDVHIATTVLYLGVVVAFIEGEAALAPQLSRFTTSVPGTVPVIPGHLVQDLLIGVLIGLLPAKSGLYRRYLRAELEHLGLTVDGDVAPGEAGDAGAVTAADGAGEPDREGQFPGGDPSDEA